MSWLAQWWAVREERTGGTRRREGREGMLGVAGRTGGCEKREMKALGCIVMSSQHRWEGYGAARVLILD